MDKPITLHLSRNEAIVLVDFLLRYRDEDQLATQHDAEQQILYDLCAVIEQQLPELLGNPNWTAQLDRARADVLAD